MCIGLQSITPLPPPPSEVYPPPLSHTHHIKTHIYQVPPPPHHNQLNAFTFTLFVCLLTVVQPQNPPPYEAPSQLPPCYEDALKHSVAVNIPGYHVMDSRPEVIRGHHLVNGENANDKKPCLILIHNMSTHQLG